MTAALREAAAKASGSRRHVYSTPRLVRYGPLRSLTTAGTRNPPEGGQGNSKRP